MIYLDNAATSWPKPETVYHTMDDFARTKAGNPGRASHSLAIAAENTIEETRRLVGRLINATDMARVIFTLNCTDALNLGLKGLLKPGDHVITSTLEHNSVTRPLRKLAHQGVNVERLAPSPLTGFVSPKTLESAINPRTRLVVITHASNVSGTIQPIAEYGEIARRHKLFFMVDAAQTAGKFPIDVRAASIDLLAFSGHKGLMGPSGTGVLYIGERADLDTIREGGTGTHAEDEEQPKEMPYRYECGTPNSVGLSGLGAGLKFILQTGLDSVREHARELTRNLIDRMERVAGITLYCAPKISGQAPVFAFNIKGYQPAEVGAVLDQAFDIKVRTGLHCAPSAHRTLGSYPLGSVRLSPGHFNTRDDVDQAARAITQIARAEL
ncbi:MAG: aminotransferase class V-fold PLP-dependent enzyme [Dehalococcoidia bacterium]|nr:MAG: aminotransferase class V-fold PLP-dependent enzyme [Dehalococcoidia bacterium]